MEIVFKTPVTRFVDYWTEVLKVAALWLNIKDYFEFSYSLWEVLTCPLLYQDYTYYWHFSAFRHAKGKEECKKIKENEKLYPDLQYFPLYSSFISLFFMDPLH